MCGLGLIASFTACDGTDESMFSNNKTESSVTIAITEDESCAPLNLVPEEVANQMDNEELALWKKMSSHFFINYDFINTAYYKNNKETIFKRMLLLYERTKNNKEPAQLFLVSEKELPNVYISKAKNVSFAYSPTYPIPVDTSDIGSIDPIPSDTSDIGREFDVQLLFDYHCDISVNNYEVTFHAGGACTAKGTPKNFTCQWIS